MCAASLVFGSQAESVVIKRLIYRLAAEEGGALKQPVVFPS